MPELDYSKRKFLNKLPKASTITPGSIIPQPVVDFSGASMLEPRYAEPIADSESGRAHKHHTTRPQT